MKLFQVLADWLYPILDETVLSPHYKTPPYLTARPEIIKHTLAPKDKFLVIASDGLWDMLSPTQVVRLVNPPESFILLSLIENNTNFQCFYSTRVQGIFN